MRLEKLLKQAPPLPYRAVEGEILFKDVAGERKVPLHDFELDGQWVTEQDRITAQLLAHAATMLPKLVDVLAQLEANLIEYGTPSNDDMARVRAILKEAEEVPES